MVLKRNKVPKRSKRIRGGTFFDELTKNINQKLSEINEDAQKTIEQWVHFIDILRDYIYQEKCTEKTTCTIEENMPEIDIEAALKNLKEHFDVKSYGNDGHERMIVKRVKSPLTKSISVLGDDVLIKSFDETFLSILKQVHGYVVTGTRGNDTKKFINMMYIVSSLPNIRSSLTALVSTEITSFKQRYKTILELLKKECSGWIKGSLCSTAANLIGDDVSDLYEKLKTNADNTNFQLTDDVLIGFIRGVLPIMIPKLYGIEEFEDDVLKLKEIVPKVGLKLIQPSASGGKKSSRATYKEILGKQMKIYTKPNDKKEYVKHKGLLISIREYKEHMKHAATGGAATTKKVILGKERCIYKVEGSKQDHIKYKGSLITVSDYKNLMKNK
jgi:hypothetical protein